MTSDDFKSWFARLFPGADTPTVIPLAADASTRRYFRAQWHAAGNRSLDSCIIMDCEPWKVDETPDFISVAEYLLGCGARAELYGIAPDQGGWPSKILVMCLWPSSGKRRQTERMRWGQEAMRALVTMHTVGTERLQPDCPAYHLAFDVPKL